MQIVPLHEKLVKLCYRDTGDVVMLQDGSGPWLVTLSSGISMQANQGGSGLYDLGIKQACLVHLENGATKMESLSARVMYYPQAAVHLGKGQ